MNKLLGIALVMILAWNSSILAQEANGDKIGQERLVACEWVMRGGSTTAPGDLVGRRYVEYDFDKGRRNILDTWESPDAARLMRSTFIDRSGRFLRFRSVTDLDGRKRKPIQAIPSYGDAPTRAFEEASVNVLGPAAVSPDGKKIVYFDLDKKRLVIGGQDGVHVVNTQWSLSHPFVWDRDSRQVAFYYALSDEDDDPTIQRHGLAVLTVTKDLREVVAPSNTYGTPYSACKEAGPSWGQSGQRLYFTAGLQLPKDGDGHPVALGAFQVNVGTGERKEIAPGEFLCVSPDESYALVAPDPPANAHGRRPLHPTVKILLKADGRSELPKEIIRPIMSPSGALVACQSASGKVSCFRTRDWRQMGNPVFMPDAGGRSAAEWPKDFRWIITENAARAD